jgi:hypothetical protein
VKLTLVDCPFAMVTVWEFVETSVSRWEMFITTFPVQDEPVSLVIATVIVAELFVLYWDLSVYTRFMMPLVAALALFVNPKL